MKHHITKATRHLIFWSLIISAILLTGLRFFLSGIETYKTELQNKISAAIEAPVTIGSMRVNIYGFTPKLVLREIDVLHKDSDHRVIQFEEIRLGINLLDIIKKRDLMSASGITLVGARLSVKRKADGSIAIEGLKASDKEPDWLFQNGRFEMLNSEVTWQDEKRHGARHQFKNVDISIDNEREQGYHHVNINMELPEKFGDSLRLSMKFSGNIFSSGYLSGRLYAEGNRISLGEMATGDLPLGVKVDTGTTNFKLWSRWHQSQMVSLTGEIQLDNTKISLSNNNDVPVQRAVSEFRWQREAGHWQLDVYRFLLDDGKNTWPEAIFSLWNDGDGSQSGQTIAASILQLSIEEFAGLLSFSGWLQEEQNELLNKLNPRGRLDNFYLLLEPEKNKVAVNGRIENFSISAVGDIPKVEKLSAYINGTELSGLIQLASRDAAIDFPGQFRQEIEIDVLDGKLSWRQTDDHWLISSPLLQLDTPDIETRNKFHITLSKHDKPVFLDLHSYFFNGKDVSRVKNYLPKNQFSKDMVDWVDQAFIAGRITEGNGLFYGHLTDYPFLNSKGVFEVLYYLEGGELSYATDWPHVTEIDSEILFYQDSLEVNFNHALVNGATVDHAVGSIASLGSSERGRLKGQITGTIEQSMGFLQQTPIQVDVNPVLDHILPSGTNVIELDMQIPLDDHAIADVKGAALLEDAEFNILSLDLPVTGISGELGFSQDGIFCENMAAEALGYPILIQILNDSIATEIQVEGKTDVGALRERFPSQAWQLAEGSTNYDVRLKIPHDEEKSANLTLTSGLEGVSLDLPEPLGKLAEEMSPFNLEVAMTQSPMLIMNLQYKDELQAALSIDKQSRSLFSGNVLLGKGDTGLNDQSGVTIGVNRERIDLQPWISSTPLTWGGEKSGAGRINKIAIKTPHFLWQGKDLGPLTLQATLKNKQWRGHIDSRFALGTWQFGENLTADSKVSMKLKRINLSEMQNMSAGDGTISPIDLPLVEIQSDQLIWNSVNLGSLNLESRHVTDGLKFERFEVVKKDSKISLSGSSWKIIGDESMTDATGMLEMEDFGAFLSQMDWTNDMKETEARIGFSIHWPGSPSGFSLETMEGYVNLDLDKGRLLGVEPGLGRILGILDLAQLDRRLKLDFSDLYREGLSYDGIKGRFKLVNGNAFTDSLVVDAVSAKISISGRTGLVARDYDQIVTVIPKSSAAIPIAGTIMKGIAGFVAKSLTGNSREGFLFRSQYAILGNWGEAEVIPLHENDGLLRKAWIGLTDFSWLSTKKKKQFREQLHE